MTPEQREEGQRLGELVHEALKTALETGDPASAAAQKACDLHRQWLSISYPNYTKEYHKEMAQVYTTDPRLKALYNQIAPNASEFFHDAINIYCS